MSYDFDVATHLRPSPEAVEAWVAERGVVADGRLAPDEVMWVQRRVRGGQSVGFSVEGPLRVALGDLNDPLRGAVLAPRWLVQLNVSGDDKDIALGRSLARYLAEEFEGAVLDPQRDAIVFSSAGTRRFRRPQGEERISILEMKWVLPPRPGPEIAERFLDALRVVPEARPRQFGDYEPLQGRLQPDDDTPFVAEWEEQLAEGPGRLGSFFWKAGSPFYGGHVFFPSLRFPTEGRVRRVSQIEMEVDSRALQQTRWREGIVDLFQETALGLEAVWGAAYLSREWLTRGRSLWADGSTEEATEWDLNILGGEWHGLPPAASWLTWFGPAYRAKVKKALGDRATTTGTGLFLRVGDEPCLPAEAKPDYPELPEELLWHRIDDPSLEETNPHIRTYPPPSARARATAAWLPKL